MKWIVKSRTSQIADTGDYYTEYWLYKEGYMDILLPSDKEEDYFEMAERLNQQFPSTEVKGQQGVIDFNKLREKYFEECTHKPKDGYIMRQHSLPPHDIFEWFKRQFAASQPQEVGQDELWDDLYSDLDRIATEIDPLQFGLPYKNRKRIIEGLKLSFTLIKK